MDRIEIYTSKKISILILIGSLGFVAVGVWLFFEANNQTGWRTIFTKGVGIATILFFGFGIFAALKRIIKSQIVLIIDPLGLNVNPNKSLSVFIKWKDINGFEEIKIRRNRIVIIGVKDPEYWLEKETSIIRKKIMEFNINNFNSPFNIAASGLNITSDELIGALNKYFDKYKNVA